MSKHTPGPWRVDPDNPADIQTENGEEIGSTYSANFAGQSWLVSGRIPWSDAEAVANSHLIAAAPDLLAACEHVVNSPNITVGDRVLLKQVIAEAKGETRA